MKNALFLIEIVFMGLYGFIFIGFIVISLGMGIISLFYPQIFPNVPVLSAEELRNVTSTSLYL